MRWPRALLLCLALAVRTFAAPPPLRSAGEILDLSPASADEGHPVLVTGVVTCSDALARLCFIHDGATGIYVHSEFPPPAFGEQVTVSGATGKGLFSPIILAQSIQSAGGAPMPRPMTAAVEQLASGRHDAQWVEVEGVVLREQLHWGHLVLTLGSGKSRVEVRILNAAPPSLPNWVDSRIKVKGVAGTTYNDRRQLTGFHLLTQNTNLVTFVEAPPTDPFSGELRVSRNMMSYSRHGAAEHRMRLRGVVTLHWPGRDFYIQDEGGGVRVQSRQEGGLQPGDVVEVVGFPSSGEFRPQLLEAVHRKVGQAAEPEARPITVEEAAKGLFESEVVAIEAMVLQAAEPDHGGPALVLESGGKVFRAHHREEWGFHGGTFPIGSRVRVQGVLESNATSGLPGDDFSIWLRRPEDARVLSLPPTWHQRRLLIALGVVGAGILAGAVWLALLRRQVKSQTAAIRRREKALEERYEDLFQNANDIIYAHDIAGRIISINNSGLKTLGYSLTELASLGLFALVEPEDHAMVRGQIQAKLDGAPRTAYEIRVRARDGRLLVFEVNSRLLLKDSIPVGVQGIARDITARKNAEEALRLSERHLRASLEQRERLGRDLHDGIIQSIYAAGLNIDDCAHLAIQDPTTVQRRLHKAVGDLNRVIREVRNFIMGLESHRLTGGEFKGALTALAVSLGETQASQIELAIDDRAVSRLANAQAAQLLLIAREALSNAIRHARPRTVTFRLVPTGRGVRFEVIDDGVGFDPENCAATGHGLRNMAARAEEIKASFQLVSRAGAGSRIVLDISTESSEQLPSENPVAHC